MVRKFFGVFLLSLTVGSLFFDDSIGYAFPTGDVVIGSDTTWAEGVYRLDRLTVTHGATLTVGGRTTIDAMDVRVDAGARISADAQGHPGGSGPLHNGGGPGGGGGSSGYDGAGAAYGGSGGTQNQGAVPGTPYGSAMIPTDLGSGGGGAWAYAGGGGIGIGGSGGGAIRMNISGTLTLDGVIGADGDIGTGYAGAGSGGSIYINAGTLAGSGHFSAKGGNRADLMNGNGSGGGGRIAVYYNVNASFGGFLSSTVNGGQNAAAGTILFQEGNHLKAYHNFEIPQDFNGTFDTLTVQNGARITIGGGSAVNVSGMIAVTGNSAILLQSKNTTGRIEAQWQGTGVTITALDVQVDAGSRISADGQGYTGGNGVGSVGNGPGGGGASTGYDAAGAAYGGAGGTQNPAAIIGIPYGSSTIPTDLGSGGGGAWAWAGGGGNGTGGRGGGSILMNVSGTLTLNGVISADGDPGDGYAGGGSGGSLLVIANRLAGSGYFSAQGGDRSGMGNGGGSGGGGRVAVYYSVNDAFTGFASSTANGGLNASVGTVGFFDISEGEGKFQLGVYENFVYPEDSSVTLKNITVGSSQATGATLAIGGGSTVNLSGILSVTENAIVTLQGKNGSAQVNGQWQGAGVTIHAAGIRVDAGARISADGQGYTGGNDNGGSGNGPGGGGGVNGYDAAGAAYGGAGGTQNVNAVPGSPYGSGTAPVDLGSGGGGASPGTGGNGGGAIRLNVSGTLFLDGIISADGEPGSGYGGAGSGGSIFVNTGILAGSGHFSTDGGSRSGLGNDGGSGGGGRIAVYYSDNSGFGGTAGSTASGGNGSDETQLGTVLFLNRSVAAPGLHVAVEGTNVIISWTSAENATVFRFYFAPYPDPSYVGTADVQLPGGPNHSVTLNLEGLGRIGFYLAVQAYNGDGFSDLSNIVFFEML